MRIPSGCSKLKRPEIIERVKGLIFGAVLGDSLGIATQGMTRDEIRQAYGKGPIKFGLSNDEDTDGQVPFRRDGYRRLYDDNDYSGDVSQLLLVIQTLVENEGQFNLKAFAKKLAIHLEKDVRQRTSDQRRDGYNGAVVRSAVLGVPKFWDGTTVIENAAESCRACVDRPDPRCMITCVILSTLVARILRAQDLEIKQKAMNDDTPLPSPSLHPPPAHTAAGGLAQPATGHYIDTLTTDEHIMSLVHAVIDLNKHLLIEPTQDRLFRLFEADQERAHTYYTQLLDYCYHAPANIEALNLDQPDDMTFKCLGTSIYAFTRQIPTQSEAETASAFKKILMDVVMQGGDAGTNAAIAGALLGVRVGYDRLPSDWVIGLKRWEWLEDRVEEFCHLL